MKLVPNCNSIMVIEFDNTNGEPLRVVRDAIIKHMFMQVEGKAPTSEHDIGEFFEEYPNLDFTEAFIIHEDLHTLIDTLYRNANNGSATEAITNGLREAIPEWVKAKGSSPLRFKYA